MAAGLVSGLSYYEHWGFTLNRCRSIAAGLLLFVLIQKVTKKIKTEKSFPATGQTPWPAFLSGLCPLFIGVIFLTLSFLWHEKRSQVLPRQQISFGKKQEKLLAS